MGLANLIRREQRATPPTPGQIGWAEYLHLWENFGFNGVNYMVPSGSIAQLTALQALRNPILLRCIIMRAAVFSEVRFSFQNVAGGRASKDLFGTPALQILEHPWPGASTGDLLGRMEIDVSMYGNSYWIRSAPNALTWLDPTRMRILTQDAHGPSGAPVGLTLAAYQSVDEKGHVLETFLPAEIIHYRPIPDPDNPFRGLSWLAALLSDITTDQYVGDFMRAFLLNSATPNLVVTLPPEISQDALQNFRDRVESSHTGPQSAFKTLYVSGGADVKSIGSNWNDMQLYQTRSYGEARLCAAAGVPPSLVGIVEGLKGSSLNAGNYTATRRSFADITIRPLWRMACAAIETVVPPPNSGARLWYDDRDVAFLQADATDAADVRQKDASTILSLVNSGFDPESVKQAVTTNDFTQLEAIPDLTSVQLQPVPDPNAPETPAIAPPDPTLKLVAKPTPAAPDTKKAK